MDLSLKQGGQFGGTLGVFVGFCQAQLNCQCCRCRSAEQFGAACNGSEPCSPNYNCSSFGNSLSSNVSILCVQVCQVLSLL